MFESYFSIMSGFIATALVTLLASTAYGRSVHDHGLQRRAIFTGEGTEWGGNWSGGNCGFSMWPQPSQYPEIAISSPQWNNAGACGACIKITGPTGRTAVGIVGDQCPSCNGNGLDMDPVLFPRVQAEGGPQWTIIPISWEYVDCDFSTPITLINKEGVSAYWVSLQVVGSRQRITKLEISTNGGSTWLSTTRQTTSNFFQPDTWPSAASSGSVRLTCQSGKQIITHNVRFESTLKVTASGNC